MPEIDFIEEEPTTIDFQEVPVTRAPLIKPTPYQAADIASMSAGLGKAPTGMEAGTEFTAALAPFASRVPETLLAATPGPAFQKASELFGKAFKPAGRALANLPVGISRLLEPITGESLEPVGDVELPRMEGKGVGTGLANIGLATTESLIQSENLVTLPLFGLGRGVGKLGAAIFGASQFAGLPDEAKNAIQVLDDPNSTKAERVQAVGQPIVATALGTLMLRHAKRTRAEDLAALLRRAKPPELPSTIGFEEGPAIISPEGRTAQRPPGMVTAEEYARAPEVPVVQQMRPGEEVTGEATRELSPTAEAAVSDIIAKAKPVLPKAAELTKAQGVEPAAEPKQPFTKIGYHGTHEKLEGALRAGMGKNKQRFLHEEAIWFAPNEGRDFDSSTVSEATRYSGDEGTIIKAKLTLKNPYFGDVDELVSNKINTQWLKDHGYDGFVDNMSGSGFVAVLDPSQIEEISRTKRTPVAEPEPAPSAKEPWQMTADEFQKRQKSLIKFKRSTDKRMGASYVSETGSGEVGPGFNKMLPQGKAGIVRHEEGHHVWQTILTEEQRNQVRQMWDSAGPDSALQEEVRGRYGPDTPLVGPEEFFAEQWSWYRTGQREQVVLNDLFDSLKQSGQHKELVKQAIREGKPVPPEVLADYPDLKPPTPTPSPPAASAKVAKEYSVSFESPAGGRETVRVRRVKFDELPDSMKALVEREEKMTAEFQEWKEWEYWNKVKQGKSQITLWEKRRGDEISHNISKESPEIEFARWARREDLYEKEFNEAGKKLHDELVAEKQATEKAAKEKETADEAERQRKSAEFDVYKTEIQKVKLPRGETQMMRVSDAKGNESLINGIRYGDWFIHKREGSKYVPSVYKVSHFRSGLGISGDGFPNQAQAKDYVRALIHGKVRGDWTRPDSLSKPEMEHLKQVGRAWTAGGEVPDYFKQPPTPPPAEPGMAGPTGGELQMAIIPGAKEFIEQDVLPKLTEGAQTIGETAQQLKAALSPPSMSEAGKLAAGIVRERKAELAQKDLQAREQFAKAKRQMDRLSKQASIQFIDRIEQGQRQTTKEGDAISAALRSEFDKRVAQVRALGTGKLKHVIQDYFPHMWKDRDAAVSWYARILGKRPLRGPASFLKHRTIPLTADGIAAGLEPVTYNPIELSLLKMHEMDRYVMGQKIFNEYKQKGLAQFSRSDIPPEGYAKIDDRIANVVQYRPTVKADGTPGAPERILRGHWYAQEDAARVLNNFLSPGLERYKWFRALRWMGNNVNMAQLGLSGYHFTFTMIDSSTTKLALGLEQLAHGDIGKGLATTARGIVGVPGINQLEYFIKGSNVLKEYTKPGTVGGDYAKIVDALLAGGGRTEMPKIFKNSSLENFLTAMRSGNYPGALVRAPFALIQAVSHPLMQVIVPRLKLGAFTDMARFEMDKMGPNVSRDQFRKAMGSVWDSVDNRMGEMVYDNLFWSKTLRDTSFLAVRAVGWNLGTLRELGGGVVDSAMLIKRLRAGDPLLTRKMAYTIALPITVGTMGAMYQYMRTGKGPQELRDYFYPLTGKTLPDGTPERVNFPSYLKDIYSYTRHPGQTVINKLHPMWSMLHQMWTNRDYYGVQTRNPDDPFVKQVGEELGFMARQFVPFAVRGAQRRVGAKESPAIKTESFFGVMPIPAEIARTPAQNKIMEYGIARIPQGARTPEEQQRTELKRDLESQIQAPADYEKARTRVRELAREGKLSRGQALYEQSKLRFESMQILAGRTKSQAQWLWRFKHLNLDQMRHVYQMATPAEKKLFERDMLLKERKAEAPAEQ